MNTAMGSRAILGVAILLLAGLANVAPAMAQTEHIEEIDPLTGERIVTGVRRPAHVIQRRTEDVAYLGLRDSYDVGDRIRVRLFDDLRVSAQVIEVTFADNGRIEVKGRFPDDPLGTFLLRYWDDGAIGTIQHHGRMFGLLPAGDGMVRVTEYDQGRFPSERRISAPTPEPERDDANGSRPEHDERPIEHDENSSAHDDGRHAPVIRILMLFPTPEFDEYCDDESLDDWGAHYTARVNRVWANAASSEVIARCLAYEPQGYKLLEYESEDKCWMNYENDNPGEKLDADYHWMADATRVSQMREDESADLVVLVVSDYKWCGAAIANPSNLTRADAGNSNAVAEFDCIEGHFTLEHELGHLLGMNHDRHSTKDGGAADCNFGYICMRDGEVAGRTVMAYKSSCTRQGGSDDACRARYARYSTPDPSVHGISQFGTI